MRVDLRGQRSRSRGRFRVAVHITTCRGQGHIMMVAPAARLFPPEACDYYLSSFLRDRIGSDISAWTRQGIGVDRTEERRGAGPATKFGVHGTLISMSHPQSFYFLYPCRGVYHEGLRGPLLTPWKYVGGVTACLEPPNMSHSFTQNRCWTTLQAPQREGWKTCVKNGRQNQFFEAPETVWWPDLTDPDPPPNFTTDLRRCVHVCICYIVI